MFKGGPAVGHEGGSKGRGGIGGTWQLRRKSAFELSPPTAKVWRKQKKKIKFEKNFLKQKVIRGSAAEEITKKRSENSRQN